MQLEVIIWGDRRYGCNGMGGMVGMLGMVHVRSDVSIEVDPFLVLGCAKKVPRSYFGPRGRHFWLLCGPSLGSFINMFLG